jgi:hypothetical protein
LLIIKNQKGCQAAANPTSPKKHYLSNSSRVPEVTYIRLYFPHAAKIPAPPLKRNGRGSRGLFAAFPAPARLLFFMSHFLQVLR